MQISRCYCGLERHTHIHCQPERPDSYATSVNASVGHFFFVALTGDAIHLLNTVSQQAREGTRQTSRSVEDGHPTLNLVSFVPYGE
jgi:hypothetical protein